MLLWMHQYESIRAHVLMCCAVQMPDAWMEQKRQAVMKYRNLFIYTTAPQNEPSASDALIDLMCSYAKFGGFQDA